MQKNNYSKGWTSIDKAIRQNAKNQNLETALYRHKALKLWLEIAEGFVKEARQLTQAVDFKKGILTVACLSREVASKIRFLAEQIITALNELMGKRVIYAIYVEV
jgi:hypothetical protein